MEWTGARYADQPTVEVQTWIDAPPERVWALVSDIELMPSMSSELQSVEWLDGASGPTVGARFTGRSKHESLGEWATTSHVIECEPGRMFAWAVEDPANPTATWRFRLEPKDGGTQLSQGGTTQTQLCSASHELMSGVRGTGSMGTSNLSVAT